MPLAGTAGAYVVRYWTEDKAPFRDAWTAQAALSICTIGKIRRQLHDPAAIVAGHMGEKMERPRAAQGYPPVFAGSCAGSGPKKERAPCGADYTKRKGPLAGPWGNVRPAGGSPAERSGADEGDGAGGSQAQGQKNGRGEAIDETFEVGDSCENHEDTHL